MDDKADSKQDGHRNSSKSRVMSKLFGRDKKPSNKEDKEGDVSAFLHGPSDKLYMTPSTALPVLPKIDTSKASRWPTVAEVNRTKDSSRGRSASPKRSKKGLMVRFTEKQPEIIGVGGDEADLPTLEISERKRSHSHPPIIQRTTEINEPVQSVGHEDTAIESKDSRPAPVHRTQTGHKAAPEIQLPSQSNQHDAGGADSVPSTEFQEAGPPAPNSFAARVQADMRAAEGKALKLGLKSFDTIDNASLNGPTSQSQRLSPAPLPIHPGPSPPSPVPPQLTPGLRLQESSAGATSLSSSRLQADAIPVGADVIREFSSRLQHLFKLFELSAESVMPIKVSSFEALVRAASWWLLKGKTNVESAVRVRPSSSEGQRSYDALRQQAHADVAKSLWIVNDIISRRAELKSYRTENLADVVDATRSTGDEYFADMLERCQTITTNLRMLAIFMQRHDFLPPPADEAPLPQGLDTTIWIKYPPFTPDVSAMLSDHGNGSLATRATPSPMKVSDAMPLGDTKKSFGYGRMFVDVFLMEEGTESRQFWCPSILSISRPQTEKNLMITISSQNGLIALRVQSDKTLGPTWNDVKWQARVHAIEVKLSRGFIAQVQCSPNDFKTLWNMYDYTGKVHAILRPRRFEEVVFEKTLKNFQYFDRDNQSRIFPKDPIAQCQVRVLEKRLTEAAGSGTRSKHRGFRIAVVTGTRTKNLSGISHDLSTRRPLQYGFMRGDGGAPALLLKFEDGAKYLTMVLTFDDVHDRSLLHSCITGGVGNNETVLAYVPIKAFSITSQPPSESPTIQDAIDSLAWHGIRVINKPPVHGSGPEGTTAVLSEHLRVIVDSKGGSLTDRINVEPSELRIRLSTQVAKNEITILRQAQEDMSISILESQVSKNMPLEMTALLETIAKSQTVRKYCFPEIKDLHTFQAAITGFSVLFDGLAETFAISRRRMVVPIYKKWEASLARVQILRHDKVVQLAAFFENFGHGECMNFVLKMTDVFESFSRSGKFCLRIVDAKFATPKGGDDKYEGIDKGFVCLDMPDYPGEHDDITIIFDSENDRDRFAKALPASVKVVSWLGTARR